jgi:hypothetical protein
MMDDTADLHRENERLRSALRAVTDHLTDLLMTERFPRKGRSADDKDATQGWWEDRVAACQQAYAALAGEDYLSWVERHPGLYIPPPGPVQLV